MISTALLPQSTEKSPLPIVLCIAGLDPSSGAGLLADSRACAAFGAFSLGVATAIVPQNTCGVRQIVPLAPNVLEAQLDAILEDIRPNAVKIGAIFSAEAVEVVARKLAKIPVPIVVDPVLAPSSGPEFGNNATIAALKAHLFPLATVLTPNAPEAETLLGKSVKTLEEALCAASHLGLETGAKNVLVKGGHLAPVPNERRGTSTSEEDKGREFSVDIFWDGTRIHHLRARRHHGMDVRGTGCMLASAIAAQLAQGFAPLDASRRAKNWLTLRIRESHAIGSGRRVAWNNIDSF